jgi:HKD family nuclease
LSDNARATKELISLTERCNSMSWAVAWATDSAVTEAAFEHRSKFRHLVIGTHQYITSPDVLDRFLGTPKFRVHLPEGDLFHPKVYCFDLGSAWVAMVGSHNLTGSAFSKNTEASVLIRGDVGEVTLQELFDFVDRQWQYARKVDPNWLYGYKVNHRRSKQLMIEASRWVDVRQPQLTEGTIGPQEMSWKEYVARVKKDKIHKVEGRLRILEEAGAILGSRTNFAQLDEDDRKRIAGTRGKNKAREGDLDWAWFGSMGASPSFATTVINNPQGLSDALAAIPTTGLVKQEEYERFVRLFMTAFNKDLRAGGGVGTGTRLLAMKRPDQFIGLNGANDRGICKAFGQPVTTTRLDNYWQRIIEPLRISEWWLAPRPEDGLERRIWDGRAAMLDALYYIPK